MVRVSAVITTKYWCIRATTQLNLGGSSMKWLFVMFLAGQTFDQSSTAMALHKGCQEANSLIPNRVGPSVAVGITVTSGTSWLFSRAHKDHPKLTNTAMAVAAGVRTMAGINNMRQMGNCHR